RASPPLDVSHAARCVSKLGPAPIENARAPLEVIGRRDGDGAGDLLGGIALLPEPLEENVAAERDADGADAPQRGALGERFEDEVEVVGVARVIEARQAVPLTTARAPDHRDPAPPLHSRVRRKPPNRAGASPTPESLRPPQH